jgi:murein DD-endopeptidase MepM/ murein hydrolase activator NlpD
MFRCRLIVLTCLALSAGAVLAAAQATVSVRARSVRPGEVLLVTVTVADGGGPVTVRAFDREWPAFDEANGRWRVLIGVDLDTKPGRYELQVGTAAGTERQPLVVQPRVFPTRRLSVNPDLVHPPPEMAARVEREARELRDIWDHPAPRRLWTEPLIRPVADAANSAFGTRSIYNGEPRPPHTGADFLSPAGRPIKAPLGGRVVLAAPQYFSGNTVIIDHGLGLFSLLAHLSEFDVRAGDAVEAGQVIGKVGATGRVTGPHLHWSLRLGNTRVDPLSLVYLLGSAPDGRHERE